jgi:Ner family transcriptional regulator
MTKPAKWDRHAILAALRRENKTLVGIAEDYGLSVSGMKNIWTRPNEPAERAIADVLRVKVEELFVDRYPKRGNRIHMPANRSTSGRAPDRDAA